MNDQSEKICPICAETIKVAAKLCPHCKADQRRGAFNPLQFRWLAWPFVLLLTYGTLNVYCRLVRPGKDFTTVRDQVSVATSTMQFSSGEKGRYVTTVGTITNGSDYAWKEVQLEARYFDRQGQLIDVGVQWFSDLVVQPHSESAFRIRTVADQPEAAYVSHKVSVRTAKDTNRWP